MSGLKFFIDKKYLKKVSYGFICFVVFIVGISTLNFNVSAKEKNEYTEDGINYIVNNNSVVIIGGDKDAKTLDIKDKYRGKKVVEIADSAFKDYTSLLYRYHDGDSEWSEILHFNYENNPSTLIYVDNSGAKNKYRATSIEKVQDLLNTKQVVDY